MANKSDLKTWVVEALRDAGGQASVADVARRIWEHHEDELRRSGDLFYTWQYDIRWAATNLRHAGVLKAANLSPAGVWELARP